jgi:4-amino-4-deoxy-L-arabinose transferase-like glycosyltransferase
VTAVLAIAVLLALVRGAAPLSSSLPGVRTLSVPEATGLLLLWIVGRHAWRQRATLVSSAMPGARRYAPELVVGVLFVVGLALRLKGIGFGAPLVIHPDESTVVGVTTYMVQTGWFKPPVPYHYPTVFPYLMLPAFALYYVKGRAAGLWTSLPTMDRDAFGFYELARAHSAVLGALTIVLVYVLARQIWSGDRGRWAGALAALFVTVSFNHVKESHFGVTDAALTFFVALALLATLRAFRRGSTAAYAVAGLACGIACATKYSGLPIAAGLVIAHAASGREAVTRWPRLAVGLAAVPVGFFIGYPYALLNWPPFLEHLGWLTSMSDGPRDVAGRFDYLALYSTKSGFGWAFTIALGVTSVRAVIRRKPEELLVLGVMALFVASLTHSSHRFFPRYLLPVVPFAALLVAGALVDAGIWLTRRVPRPSVLVPAIVTVTSGLLAAPQAMQTIDFVRAIGRPDTRVQAYHYIVEHLPPGSVVATEDPYFRLPREYRLLKVTPLHARSPEQFEQSDVEALVFSSERDEKNSAREALRRTFPMTVAFPPGPRTASGPTITVHRAPAR